MLLILGLSIWCMTPSAGNQPHRQILVLSWHASYPADSMQNAVTGLRWALSYAGAMLPEAPYAISIRQNTVSISLQDLGFDARAMTQLERLHRKITESHEYRVCGSIDIGRYVALLIGAPEHYYRITGVPERLEALRSGYGLIRQMGYVNKSNVSLVHRKIAFSNPQNGRQLFIAMETDSVTGEILEFETLDLMPNGQPRFGIYDREGKRKNSASTTHSQAGKPAKCMWCHESKISPLFRLQRDVAGYSPGAVLQRQLVAFNQRLDSVKAQLTGGVDFSQKQQHTQAELLYISFMEPSAQRLAREWKMPEDRVRWLLRNARTHEHEEFKFLGTLYDRNEVEPLAPVKGLAVPAHVREFSPVEVNYLEP